MRRENLSVLVLGLALVLVTWRVLRPDAEPPPAPPGDKPAASPRTPSSPGPTPPEAQASPEPPRRARTWSEGSRVHVPRPSRLSVPYHTANAAPSPDDTDVESELPTTLTAEQIREVIREDVLDPLQECVTDWMEVDPGLEGRVVVGFTVGPEGLVDVEIVDHTEVPPGPLACFSEALWDADWPPIAGDVVVNYPFVFFDDEADD